jgi:hypothetical protein
VDETFYIRVRGKVQGPFTLDELRAMAGRGQFSRVFEVSSDRIRWVRASNRPDLFPSTMRVNPAESLAAEVLTEPVEAEEIELEPVLPTSAQSVVDAERLSSPGGQWYFAKDRDQHGPVEFAQLEQMVRTGIVSPHDLVWTDGMPQWVAVEDLPEHFSQAMATSNYGGLPLRSASHFAAKQNTLPIGESRTSGLAVASLVLGLLGWNLLPVLGSLLAVVFGHSAMKEIRRSNGVVSGSGMATAGLVMGYFVLVLAVAALVVILIVAIVAAFRDIR